MSEPSTSRNLSREEASDIFMRYFGFVRAIAFENAPSKSLVDDIAHEVYICFVEKAETWQYDETKIEALLRSITENIAHRFWKTWLRSQPEHLRQLAEYIKQEPCEDVVFQEVCREWDEKMVVLDACLAKLPKEQRELVEAIYLSGKGYSEVIQSQEKSRNTLYQQMARIRAILEKCVNFMLRKELE